MNGWEAAIAIIAALALAYWIAVPVSVSRDDRTDGEDD